MIDRNFVKFLKEQYPKGTRIRLNSMSDPYAPVEPGTEGSVEMVDDAGQLLMKWDNGRTLALIPGEDSFSVLPPKLTTLKLYMPMTVDRFESDGYGGTENEPTELSNYEAVRYVDSINAALRHEELPAEAERGLMHYYTIDPSTQTQTVVVKPADTQTITVYNDPIGGVEIIKVNEADRNERIPNTTFEIRRVGDDAFLALHKRRVWT